jgi:alkyldihydroxyacetonephosphate synthase
LFSCKDSFDSTFDLWRSIKSSGAAATVAQGISHQHGVGFDHKDYLLAEKGDMGISAIRQVLKVFDPSGRMNPGKLLPDE